jgi:hypothetical protein
MKTHPQKNRAQGWPIVCDLANRIKRFFGDIPFKPVNLGGI